jgi:uncharacterized membrane protein
VGAATEVSAETSATPRWWGRLALVLSLAGVGDALYLTIDHFTGALPVCSTKGVIDCAKVTTSPESTLFGVFPVSLLGLLFFGAMVVVNLPPLWQPRGTWRTRLAWIRLGMAVGSMSFVVWLLYAEVFLIKAICLWCTGVHVLTFALFVLVVSTFSPLIVGRPRWEE